MFELLREFSQWVSSFGNSDWVTVVLVLTAFTESIFNPIPPDPLLIAASIFRPHLALWFAAVTTISSVLGALVGRWLGLRFGRPILYRLINFKKVDLAERLFQKYGVWAIFLAAFTPIPYKGVAILAGVMRMNGRLFILVSLVGRGMRYFLLAAIIALFGKEIEDFIVAHFELVTVLFSGALVLITVIGFDILRRRRRAN